MVIGALTVPPASAAQLICTPLTPLPKVSTTVTASGTGNWPTCACWASPPDLTSRLAAPATAVTVKLTGDPAAPVTVAVMTLGPDVLPAVYTVAATPDASVLLVAGSTLPPPELTPHVTGM